MERRFLNHRLELDIGLINQLLPIEFKGGARETQLLAATGATGNPAPKSQTHLRIQPDSIKPNKSFRFERYAFASKFS